MSRNFKKSIGYLSFAAIAVLSSQAFASDFNIPFVSTSGLGDMYSGWAVSANDASTAYTNPAGLTEIKNKQLVISGIGLLGTTQFQGTTNTTPSLSPNMNGSASSKLSGFIPSIYFAAPVSNNLVFALSQNVPFALGTNYTKDSIVRYAATKSQIVVVDVGPSVGFKFNEKLSVGLGLDFERMAFTLNRMNGFPLSFPANSESQNHLSGWGYGFHGGLLYKLSQATRLGVNYNSQVMFHTSGDSEVFTTTNTFRTTSQKANAALPAMAQFSIEHDITQQWTALGTVFYTRWSTFNQLSLKNTMLPTGSTMNVTIPFGYHDTLDYSLGLNYKPTEKWILKTGVQLLNTPSNNRDRSLPDPVGQGTIVALGAHYQQNKQLGYDVGYAHAFFRQTAINHASPLEFASGNSNQNTNLLGAQVTWDIV